MREVIDMLKRFLKSTDGNVSMMFGVSLTAVLVCVGAALDLSSAKSAEQDLQDMVDAATLAAARQRETEPKMLEKVANAMIEELNNRNLNIKFELTVVDDEVHIVGKSIYNTRLMGLVGRDQVPLEARARAPISFLTPVKLALVLDTTTSMEGDDIAALRTAAGSMIDVIDESDAPIAVSVVPFGQYVNLGLDRRNEPWLDVSKDGTSETEPYCYNETVVTKASECKPNGVFTTYDDIRDGRNFGQVTSEGQDCTPEESYETGNEICSTRTTNYTWSGCVGSRDTPYNEKSRYQGRLFTGVMNRSCGTPMLELTQDLDTVRATIDSLTTNGSTYLPSGAIWGWRTLEDRRPFRSKAVLDKDGKKVKRDAVRVMLLMTDGENTLSQGGYLPHLHNGSSREDADKRTANICEKAKEDGIEIYTVGYRMTAALDTSRSLIRECASTTANAYTADNAKELDDVFKQIVGKLDSTRLSM